MPENDAEAEKEALIQGYVEGALTPEESARLHELVRQDPLLARVIAQSLRMDGAIREVTSGKEAVSSPSREEISDITPRRGTRRFPSTRRTRVQGFGGGQVPVQFAAVFAAAAVLLVLGLLFSSASRPAATPSVAKKSIDARRSKWLEEYRQAEARRREAEERLQNIWKQQEALKPSQPAPDPEKRKLEFATLEEQKKRVEREVQDATEKEFTFRLRQAEEDAPTEEPPVKPVAESPREEKSTTTVAAPTRVEVASVERVGGDVWMVAAGRKTSLTLKPEKLWSDQGIETSAAGRAVLTYGDETKMTAAPGSELRDFGIAGGKRLWVERGDVEAKVAKQPDGQPMIFRTPHGEITVLGTTLRIRVVPSSTRLDVIEGKVRLKNLEGKSIEVVTGHYAVAVAGTTALQAQPLKKSRAEDELEARGAVWIRFGPATAPLPPGFLMDAGEVFDAVRGYGWEQPVWAQLSPNLAPNSMKAGFASAGDDKNKSVWRMKIPNGRYAVTVCVGGVGVGFAEQGPHHVAVEGIQIIDKWITTKGALFHEPTRVIAVTDYELTMVAGGPRVNAPRKDNSSDTLINYIVIQRVDGK